MNYISDLQTEALRATRKVKRYRVAVVLLLVTCLALLGILRLHKLNEVRLESYILEQQDIANDLRFKQSLLLQQINEQEKMLAVVYKKWEGNFTSLQTTLR